MQQSSVISFADTSTEVLGMKSISLVYKDLQLGPLNTASGTQAAHSASCW